MVLVERWSALICNPENSFSVNVSKTALITVSGTQGHITIKASGQVRHMASDDASAAPSNQIVSGQNHVSNWAFHIPTQASQAYSARVWKQIYLSTVYKVYQMHHREFQVVRCSRQLIMISVQIYKAHSTFQCLHTVQPYHVRTVGDRVIRNKGISLIQSSTLLTTSMKSCIRYFLKVTQASLVPKCSYAGRDCKEAR